MRAEERKEFTPITTGRKTDKAMSICWMVWIFKDDVYHRIRVTAKSEREATRKAVEFFSLKGSYTPIVEFIGHVLV